MAKRRLFIVSVSEEVLRRLHVEKVETHQREAVKHGHLVHGTDFSNTKLARE